MKFQIFFVIFALAIVRKTVQSTKTPGHCIWYGVCNVDILGGTQNCLTNTPARPLDSKGLELVSVWCGHLNESKLCCDNEQLTTLNKNLLIAANFLKNCASCLNNLVKHICEFTCSPEQSNFIEIKKTANSLRGEYITEMNLHIAEEYMNATYDSCSKVSFSPALGITVPAMDLMCGKYTSTDCSPQKWFDLMGDSEIPYVPFQINYIPHESRKVSSKSKFTPLNPDVTPCHAAVDAGSPACECNNCPASCPNNAGHSRKTSRKNM